MIRKVITINEEKCQKCGLCVKICPMRIYTQERDGHPVIGDMENCVLCGHCIAVCPHDAINHNTLPSGHFIRINNPNPVSEEDLFAALRQRRSVRAFQKQDVPRDVLYEIAQCCGYCPTGAHGGDGWKRNVIIVTGKENMRQVLEYTTDYMEILKRKLNGSMVKLISRWVPVIRGGLSTLPDLSLRLDLYRQGKDVILYNAPALILIHTPNDTATPQADCDAALYAMMLEAQSKGLGTCWMGWVQYAASGFKVRSFSKLKEFLKVPSSHDVYSAMVLGYPAIKLHSVPYRVTECTWIDQPQGLKDI